MVFGSGHRRANVEFVTRAVITAKYYDTYRPLLYAALVSGLYFSPIEKIVHRKWILTLCKFIGIFPSLFLLSFLGFQLKFIALDEGNIREKLFAFINALFCLLSAFVILSFYMRRKEFVRLWEWWETNFKDDPFPEDRTELQVSSSRSTMKWVKTLIPASIVPILMYTFITFFNKNKDLGAPTGIAYRHQSPDFELLTIYNASMCISGFLVLQTHDSLTMVFLSLENTQLLHLKRSLGRIIGLLSVDPSGNLKSYLEKSRENGETADPVRQKEALKEIEKKIRQWIIHHQKLIWFHDEIHKIFVPSMSVKGFIFYILLIGDCFLITKKGFETRILIVAIAFCFTNYFLFYVNIQYADSIAETGRDIFDEAFGLTWNVYPRRVQSSLGIVATRTCRTLRFMALKIFPFNSKCFLGVLSSGYTFLTFLLHVAKDKE